MYTYITEVKIWNIHLQIRLLNTKYKTTYKSYTATSITTKRIPVRF